MNNVEIKKLIDTRIKEYKSSLETLQSNMDELNTKKKKYDFSQGKDNFLLTVQKLQVLKDQSIMLQSAVNTLKLLKEDINGQKVHKQDQK